MATVNKVSVESVQLENVWILKIVKFLQVCSETGVNIKSNFFQKDRDSLIEPSNTLIEQSSHATERVSFYPQEANMSLAWYCKCNLHIKLSSCCPLNTDYSEPETMHNNLFINIFLLYKTTNILDNKMSVASEELYICPQILALIIMPTNSGALPSNFMLLLLPYLYVAVEVILFRSHSII